MQKCHDSLDQLPCQSKCTYCTSEVKDGHRWDKNLIIKIALIAILAMLVGCSQGINLKSITSEAISNISDLNSLRTEGIQIYIFNGNVETTSFESEYVDPDRYRGISTSSSGSYEIIKIGDKSYYNDLNNPQWLESTCDTCVVLSVQDSLSFLESLVNLELLPDDVVDSVECLHYSGTVDMDSYVEKQNIPTGDQEISEALDTMRKWKVRASLWVCKDSNLIRQIILEVSFPCINCDDGIEQWTTMITWLRLFDFNEPIEITDPMQG